MQQLTGKVALVCGASQGIGAACAESLAEAGCAVIALARNAEKLQQLMERLPQTEGQRHRYLSVDIGDHQALEAQVADCVKSYGAIEVLVNNSGGPKGGAIASAEAAQFNEAFHNHLQANVLLSQLLLPGMKEKQYGRIVNILSTSVKTPIPNLGVSNTIRWAVAAWAKTLSLEVAQFGITVNSVLPGATNTQRLQQLFAESAKRQNVSLAEIEQQWLAKIPARRFGEAKEIAAAVTFLASPAASYVNGVALPVDGGRTGCL